MATKASQTHLFRLLNRNFASAASKPASATSTEVRTTALPNKLLVASSDAPGPCLSRISVAIKAGSRYENLDNLGVSHVLRSSAGLSTKDASQFSIVRNLQQLGAGLSASSDREMIVYTLESTSSALLESLKYLNAIVTGQLFKPWELQDNVKRIEYEVGGVPPQATLIDLLHKAAFRDTLGNSIFVKEHNIKKIGSETLLHYVQDTFKSNRAAVAGIGVDHECLLDFANSLCLNDSEGCSSPAAKYSGGEIRIEANLPHAHIALAGEAPSLQKKEVFAWAVLAAALGGDVAVPFGSGSSPMAKAASCVSGSSVNAVLMPHSDSGLLAIVASGPPSEIGQVASGIKKALESVSDADIERGKAKVVSDLLTVQDTGDDLLTTITTQALLTGQVTSPKALAQAVSQISTSSVKEALSSFRNGKKAFAALGQIHNAPYLDEM